MLGLVLACLTILPRLEPGLHDRADVVELNHFFDEKGELSFDQIIWHEWSRLESRFVVRDWRRRTADREGIAPVKDWSAGDYRSLWIDWDQLRDVRAKHYLETWTQYDPELAARDYFPKEDRRGLSSRVPRTQRRH